MSHELPTKKFAVGEKASFEIPSPGAGVTLDEWWKDGHKKQERGTDLLIVVWIVASLLPKRHTVDAHQEGMNQLESGNAHSH